MCGKGTEAIQASGTRKVAGYSVGLPYPIEIPFKSGDLFGAGRGSQAGPGQAQARLGLKGGL